MFLPTSFDYYFRGVGEFCLTSSFLFSFIFTDLLKHIQFLHASHVDPSVRSPCLITNNQFQGRAYEGPLASAAAFLGLLGLAIASRYPSASHSSILTFPQPSPFKQHSQKGFPAVACTDMTAILLPLG
jgi:hypothetical protein